MTQNDPYRQGEVLFRAFFPRQGEGLVITSGVVVLADDKRFLVRAGSREESQAQTAPGGWRRTREEALDHLDRGLTITRTRVEADALRLKAKSHCVRKLRGELSEEAQCGQGSMPRRPESAL
ncbi:hypothetical protein [Nitratidesulfovibrio vulgaris]|uniref:Uncharacterized protein n=1 Tax=Nitratidesulfovibrio vulgaris (strain ATCC 29579 / DSM 644 / CCUG 34227 / NCIMB 8303 / VKM B-1760 / Hildenborough) TaxID=882 RepID=Q727M5_NITV2|nr:hypothetical protein [Nitratidesulfovibrio vulgaris]AAS97302.1 hypothetical protein DVU_2830 [Nitratidesulfovibrio vulgaris str. Hildenborough]ADP87753.1 hypothetical protein Deval_2611 [Nitratidesulfovibrio vulgaris RCH1]